jgi:hypothetical protein
MKKRILLITAVGTLGYVTLTSSASGPGGNYTGSTGGAAGCGPSSCHGSSATTGIGVGFILDSAGTIVTRYKPGITYKIKVMGNSTGTSLPKFGFQLMAVKGSGSTAAAVGTFGTAPTGTHVTASKVWEHVTPLSGSGATVTVYMDSISWTAPAVGTGTVTIYAALNAVNNNNASTGDSWNTSNFAYNEITPSASVTNVTSSTSINAYPNPVAGTLNLQFNNVAYGNYNVAVYDLAGKQVASQTASVNGVSATISLDASNWAPGLYNAAVEKDGARQMVQVVKQ